jgi:lipopolysaccharide transport system ATP-binding protein
MYMRLAFAVAAHLEPEILIVDEVLAVGDLEFQKKCLGKMEDVSKGGRTVLFVSHNMDAILRMCSRCILLNKGRVEANCGVRQAIAHYVHQKQQQESVLDLRVAPRSWEPRLRARFTDAAMLHADGSTRWSIPYGEPFEFQMHAEVHAPLSGLEIGTCLFTAMGVEITGNSSAQYLPLQNVNIGNFVYRIKYEGLRLVPGSYQALLWIRSSSGWEDFIYKAFEFDVETSELSSQHKTDFYNAISVPAIQCSFKTQTG